MRVKCVAETLPRAWREAIAISPALDERRTFGVVTGQTYAVFGLEVRQGVSWVQVEVAPDELISVPIILFDIVDPTVPDGWEAHVSETGELVLWPAAFFSSGFHERLYAGDATAKAALERLRRHIDDV